TGTISPGEKEMRNVFPAAGHRGGALLLDLVLIAFAASLLGAEVPYRGVVLAALVLLYFAAMPLTPLQGTLGKWICRLKLCDRNGARLAWWRSLLRAALMLAWLALPVALENV